MPHIVVADDDQMILRLVGRIVESLGWTVDLAANGAEALALMQIRRPDLALTDIEMPQMDGLQLTQMLKSSAEFAQTPVVVMSSSNRESLALAAGCDAFISKPFTPAILIDTLRRFIP